MAHTEDPRPEEEAHGATPPHGDPLTETHQETGGPHEHGVPEDDKDTSTPPHGDPLR